MKRPNPISHMMLWGAGSGLILALLYLTLIIDVVGGANLVDVLALWANPLTWGMTLIFGVLPGIVLGFFTGIRIWDILRDVTLPFTKDDMLEKRNEVYGWTFAIVLIVSFWLIFNFVGTLVQLLLLLIPPFLAAAAATYAAHRYMFRLRLWSANAIPRKAKEKAKHAETRLTGEVDYNDIIGEMEEIADYQKQDYL